MCVNKVYKLYIAIYGKLYKKLQVFVKLQVA